MFIRLRMVSSYEAHDVWSSRVLYLWCHIKPLIHLYTFLDTTRMRSKICKKKQKYQRRKNPRASEGKEKERKQEREKGKGKKGTFIHSFIHSFIHGFHECSEILYPYAIVSSSHTHTHNTKTNRSQATLYNIPQIDKPGPAPGKGGSR